MHGNDGIKPVRDFWKNGAHSGALFSTSPLPSLSLSLSLPFSFLPPSLSVFFSFFFLPLPPVSVTASDSGWQPPGFLKANITAKR